MESRISIMIILSKVPKARHHAQWTDVAMHAMDWLAARYTCERIARLSTPAGLSPR